MNTEEAREWVATLREQLPSLPPHTRSAEFSSWYARATSVLANALGPTHHIVLAFAAVRWTPRVLTQAAFDAAFNGAREETDGLLDAALFEIQHFSGRRALVDDMNVDPELWEHVNSLVVSDEWGKVSSQAAIFTEDRIRRWTGQPVGTIGERLMTAVFGKAGDYRLGRTEGEQEGWHRLAMGISMALRNADTHRIESRPDHERYSFGVLCACSLLLTQLRHEHGNRFLDVEPLPLDRA